MPDANRVSLRVWMTRDDFRAIDRRADATHTSREDVAASLLAQALREPAAELVENSPQVAPTAFTRAAWGDALTANPHIAAALLRLLGDADR